MLRKWDLTIQPLTPLLRESGSEFERKVRRPVILLQPSLEAPLGNYLCNGRADVVRLHRDRKDRLHVLVADIKASRHLCTYNHESCQTSWSN